MSIFPHDDQQDHGHDAALAALRLGYPQWVIGFDDNLHVWTAEYREPGGAVRFLAGHDLAELAARLETATTVAP